MRRTRKVIRLFLASPGDVVEERTQISGVSKPN